MVSEQQFSKLFPGVPYQGTTLDTHSHNLEFQIPPLRPGVTRSIDKMAQVLLRGYDLEQVRGYIPDIEPQELVKAYNQSSGWWSAQSGRAIDYPEGKVLVLDCETFVKAGSVPVMAVALTVNGFYIWQPEKLGDLIPVAPGSLVIAHNASYEACRIKQAYTGEALFLDTLSMAKQCVGFASAQTWVTRAKDSTRLPRYASYGSSLSLSGLYKFFGLGELDKEARDVFVSAETYQEIEDEWDNLLAYNIKDVIATTQLFGVLYAKYQEKIPSPTSLYGLIHSSSYRLPLVPDWFQWIDRVEDTYNAIQVEISTQLTAIAEQWVARGYQPNNPWMAQLDWTIKPKARILKGYPEWYRKARRGSKSSYFVTIKSQLAHLLLELTYLDYPVEYTPGKGWGSQAGQVPHPSGKGNVGYLFSKDLQDLYDRGDIASNNPQCSGILARAMQLTYWTSVRTRVMEQQVHPDQNGVNWCIPQTGGGTITGRVTDPLWLTTSDAKPNKVGSELKSRITAPPGHKLLCADFSAQEMRIAWMLADSLAHTSGATPMSMAGYLGDKNLGTDSHSATARIITEHLQQYIPGAVFSRDAAKTINFAMLYMAGEKTVGDGIYRNSRLSAVQASAVARSTLESIRGKVSYYFGSKEYSGGTNSESYTAIDNICNKDFPRTPLLHREMSDPLCPAVVGSDFYTTRANWVIQGSARDMLDILITAFTFLCRHFNVDARVIWSRHDEVIILARDNAILQAGNILQVAHTYCWAALHEELGLYDMPALGLLFDDITVDTTVRKNPSDPCITPSNTEVIYPGYTLDNLPGIANW